MTIKTSYPDAPYFVKTEEINQKLRLEYSKENAHEIVFNRRDIPQDIIDWHAVHGLELKDDVLWKCKTIRHKKSDPQNTAGCAYNERIYDAGYSFADAKMAMLFKLTFGGAA